MNCISTQFNLKGITCNECYNINSFLQNQVLIVRKQQCAIKPNCSCLRFMVYEPYIHKCNYMFAWNYMRRLYFIQFNKI